MNKTMTAPKAAPRRLAPASALTIPTTMMASVMTGYGGLDKLQTRLVPVPKPGPHEALIHLVAAGLGSWDPRLRAGQWRGEVRPPVILGADGSGIIVAKGARVRGLELGDEVYACSYLNPKGGFHAEYACVPEERVALKPRSLSLEQAGAVCTTALTAMQGIDRLGLRKGGVALVFGASGGVGAMAVQFARAKGAVVIGTASGKGLDYLRGLGVDACFDPKDGLKGFEKALDAVGAASLDAVLALAGGELLQGLLGRVRVGGKVAFPNGVEPEPQGVTGVKVEGYNGEPSRKALDELSRRVDAIPLFDAHVDAVFPLDQAAKAHARQEAGGVVGKVLLQIDPAWSVHHPPRPAAAAPRRARPGRARRRH